MARWSLGEINTGRRAVRNWPRRDPATTAEPILQAYGARAFRWRGAFSVHTWIAVKREGAEHFTTYEVVGWRHWQGLPAVARTQGPPDRHWFGSRPTVYLDLRGEGVEALIDKVEAAVESYPYKNSYRTWPGPNSNTFTAYVARAVPELGFELPSHAIGKDYLGATDFVASAPSGTGYQISLFGLFGLLLAREEGLEVTILGLNFGIDPLDLAIKLPGVGSVGPGAT
jgi:hypothetical protein